MGLDYERFEEDLDLPAPPIGPRVPAHQRLRGGRGPAGGWPRLSVRPSLRTPVVLPEVGHAGERAEGLWAQDGLVHRVLEREVAKELAGGNVVAGCRLLARDMEAETVLVSVLGD